MNIAIVGLHEVDQIWPLVAEGLQKACQRCGEMTSGELWTMCRSGHAFLIIIFEKNSIIMASVWRFESKNGRPVFRCEMMYGHGMGDWLEEARLFITKLAKENGAKALVAEGRRGWLRLIAGAVECAPDYEVEI